MQPDPSTFPGSTPRRAAWLGALIIIIVGIAAYHNSLGGPFVFDDPSSITANPTIRRLWPIWEPLTPPRAAITVQGRPLVNFSLALNYALGGESVRGYHVLNLAIHLAAALTLFGLVRRTLQRPGLPPRLTADAWSLALTVAVLWTAHPLQTQAVTYVIQRAESLMGLFYLLTLYAFVRGAGSPRPARWFGLAIAACAAGMATKEVMVTAPVVVLFYDRAFVSGSFLAAWRRHRVLYLGLAAGWLLLAALVLGTGGNRGGAAGGAGRGARRDYAKTPCGARAHDLRLALWPQPLVFEYGTFWVDDVRAILPSALTVAALVVVTAYATWRRPALGFPGCFAGAVLAVTSLVPGTTQMIVEHRMYLPLAAVLVVAVLAVHACLPTRARFAWAAAAAAAAALAVLTQARNEDYRDERTLWRDTVAKRPANALARELHAQALERAGAVDAAIAERRRALEIFPAFAVAHCNLGDTLVRLGRSAEAVPHYEAALQSKPAYADAHNGLGSALAQTGRLPEAIEHLTQALALAPEFTEARHNLSALHNQHGNALAAAGRLAEARRALTEALRLTPDNANYHYNLGNVLLRLGRSVDARGQFEAAVARAPAFAEAHGNLGAVLLELREPAAARRVFENLIALAPRLASAHLGLGEALYQLGRPAEARAAYERALALDPALAPARAALRRLDAPP